VDALEEDGLVARSPHATDRRVTVLTITPEGQRLLVTAGRERSKVISELFGTLSPQDRAELDRSLGSLRDAAPDPPDGWKKAKNAVRRMPVNRLATTSYLRQHATTRSTGIPRAKRSPGRTEDKPLLLDQLLVRHWCHVWPRIVQKTPRSLRS
jgi:hypothetical protein